MKLEILTPRKIELQEEVDDIVLPTLAGEISVLSQHAPLISILKPGRIRVRAKNKEIVLSIEGGILQVFENSATILLRNFHLS